MISAMKTQTEWCGREWRAWKEALSWTEWPGDTSDFIASAKTIVGKEVDASKELNGALRGWSTVSVEDRHEKRLGGGEQGGVARFRAL